MSDLFPLSICSSVVRFGTADEGYELHVAHGDAERVFRARITFATAFAVTPLVHVAVSGFDIDHGDTARLRVAAEAITPTGFDLVLTTWLGTKVYSAEAAWIAIGQPAA